MLLVSLHMPKTAGTSFGAALQAHFGDGLSMDYGDYPLNVAPSARHQHALESALTRASAGLDGTDCVHGHFLPIKYLLLADRRPCRFVTWLREPVARLVSHYHYWYDVYDPDSPDTRPLHRRVVEEKWSLEKFCLSAEMRNIYSQFLWGFPLEYFDFIGTTENYEEDMRLFSSTYIGQEASILAMNRRESRGALPESEALSTKVREEIERWHAADMTLYHRVLAARAGHGVGAR